MLKSHAVAIDESNTMNHPTPQGLPVRDLTDDEKQFLHYNPNTSDLVEFVQAYAREALAAQAATLESIHKIIECAGPDAAGEIADLLGYPSVEWPSDQALTAPNLACKSAQARLATQWGYVRAASVEPVGKIINSGGNTGSLPEHPLLVWLGGVPPVGTELYASAPPSPASVQNASLVEKLAKRTCEANADSARFTIALQTLRASLDPDDWMGAVTMHNYIDAVLAGGSPLQQHPAPSPAQAVDAVGESCAIFDSRGYYDWYDTEAQAKAWCDRYNARNVDDPLRPYTYVRLDALRAALQASRQPQAQQGGGENTARAFIEWCKAQPEDRVPVSIDEALNEFEAALATKETKVCHSQNASQTPQADLSLTAAPQEWSPAYTRGPSRQSAPVTAVPAMVPLTEEQMVSAVRPLCNTDQVAERLVAVSVDEYRAIEAAIAKINGLTVGDGAQPIKGTP